MESMYRNTCLNCVDPAACALLQSTVWRKLTNFQDGAIVMLPRSECAVIVCADVVSWRTVTVVFPT
jgi:hypothetical protein